MFHYGDTVRISDDMARVHSLQPGHGEWNDDMALVRIEALYHSILGMCLRVCINFSGSHTYYICSSFLGGHPYRLK